MYARRLFNELWSLAGRALLCARALLLSLVFLGVVFAPGSASAQSASFRSVDTNSDGYLTFNELAAAFGRAGANRLLGTTDHNGDGRITVPELRRTPDRDDRDDDGRPRSSGDRDDGRDDDRDDDRRADDDGRDDDNDDGDDDGGGGGGDGGGGGGGGGDDDGDDDDDDD